MFGSQCRLLSTASEVNCRHTLRWTPFFLCTLAASGRCSANDLLIYSSRPRSSCLLAASFFFFFFFFFSMKIYAECNGHTV